MNVQRTASMDRRAVLVGSAALSGAAVLAAAMALSGCASQQGAIGYATVRLYADDLIDAIAGAARGYPAIKPPPSDANLKLVSDVVAALQQAQAALDAAAPSADAKTIVLEVITGVQTVAPLLSVLLGPAGPYVPLALALLQAFVQGLPAPSTAPPTPPAALHTKAALYRTYKAQRP